LLNLVHLYGPYIRTLRFWKNGESDIFLVFSHKKLIDLLPVHGQESFFLNGTFSVVENKLQVTVLMVRYGSYGNYI
jgi:hypothetical protein